MTAENKKEVNEYFKTNRKLWDDLTKIHFESEFYDVEGFKKGKCTLLNVEIDEVGSVTDKSLLHLQCHFGQDTLCWARLGAKITGMDFSKKAIEQAISLAKELDIPARFICCDVYELAKHLDEKYDIVFTSAGVLAWLPDLKRWAEVISHFLKPNGIFYIREFHPAAYMFDDADNVKTPTIRYPYFKLDEPLRFEESGSYANPNADINSIDYEWTHSMSEIINSLIEAGLKIEYLHEFNYCTYKSHPFLTQGDNGMWRFSDVVGGLPLMFSIRAVKK